jgi:gamma-glutamylcyclotransferase (GGCT)/AIG2-like uncharacterized protein YtfP
MKNNKNYILVYGTLRRGDQNTSRDKVYNFNRFGGQKYIETLRLKGFSLYSLGPYPCVVEDKSGEITIELHEIENESLNYIDSMESGAGYDKQIVEIKSKELKNKVFAGIYYYHSEDLPTRIKNNMIKSGDWLYD